jgi:hypothetical protein
MHCCYSQVQPLFALHCKFVATAYLDRVCAAAAVCVYPVKEKKDIQAVSLHTSFNSSAKMTTPATFITPQITSRSADRVAEDIDKYEVRKGRCQPQPVGGLNDASLSCRFG